MFRVDVELRDFAYPVLIGDGARHALPEFLPDSAARVAVVTQKNIPWEVDLDRDSKVFHIPDGEPAKSMATVEKLCREFASWGLTRTDVVVAVGGGVVTDIAGFVGAVYHRGIAVINVATSLLAQVDAAIGGKTGVNIPEGKNLIGAFWQPQAVFCDTETLATLPEGEHRCGRGEMAKYHFLGAGSLIDLPQAEQVLRCVKLKAEIVSQDERELGRRALLNYGHTLAHALESACSYGLSHGEAVAVGLMYAAEVARILGRIDTDRVAEYRQVIGSFGLEARLSEQFAAISNQQLLGFFKRDKKATKGLTMVLDGPDGIEVVNQLPHDLLLSAMERIR